MREVNQHQHSLYNPLAGTTFRFQYTPDEPLGQGTVLPVLPSMPQLDLALVLDGNTTGLLLPVKLHAPRLGVSDGMKERGFRGTS